MEGEHITCDPTVQVALEPQSSVVIQDELKHDVQNPTLASSGCLRSIYTWSRDSRALVPVFICLVVLVIVFGGALLNETTSLLWLVLFGLVACLVTFSAPLLQLSEVETISALRFLQRDSNGVRIFMMLEAIADIALAVYRINDVTTPRVVLQLAIGATTCASIALLILVYGATANEFLWQYKFFTDRTETFLPLIPLAIVLNDTADVLLIIRVVISGEVEEKDVLLYLFLLLNVLISELSTLFAILAEETKAAAGIENEDKEKEEGRLKRAKNMREAMRRKATVQTVVSGLAIIPLVLTSILREELNAAEATLLVVPPIATFFWIAYIQRSNTKILYMVVLFGVQVRELLPRFVLVVLFIVIAFVDEALSLAQDVQAMAYGSYAFYLFCPLLLRFVGDYSRASSLKREIYSAKEFNYKGRLTGI